MKRLVTATRVLTLDDILGTNSMDVEPSWDGGTS